MTSDLGATSQPVPARSRAASAAELLLGTAVVLGHNVFGVLPNEVPILFVLGLVSYRLRNGSLAAMGLVRPASWARTVLIAAVAAAARLVLGELVDRLTTVFLAAPKPPEEAWRITGDVKMALLALLIVWTFAAFGEEIGYRGYLLNRGADIGSNSGTAYIVSMVFVSVLFGCGHLYKGVAGIFDSGFAGLVLGVAYLASGRNLWTSILAHGFIDTVGVVALYFGWAT